MEEGPAPESRTASGRKVVAPRTLSDYDYFTPVRGARVRSPASQTETANDGAGVGMASVTEGPELAGGCEVVAPRALRDNDHFTPLPAARVRSPAGQAEVANGGVRVETATVTAGLESAAGGAEDESTDEEAEKPVVKRRRSGSERRSYLKALAIVIHSKQMTLEGEEGPSMEEVWKCPFCPGVSFTPQEHSTGPLSVHFRSKHPTVLRTVLEDENGRKRSRAESVAVAEAIRAKAQEDNHAGACFFVVTQHWLTSVR